MPTQPIISAALRTAISEAPMSLRRISVATGVAPSVLSRFMRGEQGITLDTADTLAAYLELELVPKNRHGKGW